MIIGWLAISLTSRFAYVLFANIASHFLQRGGRVRAAMIHFLAIRYKSQLRCHHTIHDTIHHHIQLTSEVTFVRNCFEIIYFHSEQSMVLNQHTVNNRAQWCRWTWKLILVIETVYHSSEKQWGRLQFLLQCLSCLCHQKIPWIQSLSTPLI